MANERLSGRISALQAASDGVLGRRRIADDLADEGERCSPNRVGRLMNRAGLKGVPQRRARSGKASHNRPTDVSNQLQRQFSKPVANQAWVTDITYARTTESWLYLCVVIDLYYRQVVGWSMSKTQEGSWFYKPY